MLRPLKTAAENADESADLVEHKPLSMWMLQITVDRCQDILILTDDRRRKRAPTRFLSDQAEKT